MKLILLTVFLQLCASSPVLPSCEIISDTVHSLEHDINVSCEDEMNFSLKMKDKDGVSTLEVTGNRQGEEFRFLNVEHNAPENTMFLTLEGKRFDVKDESSAAEESEALENLMKNPDFSSFSVAVQLI